MGEILPHHNISSRDCLKGEIYHFTPVPKFLHLVICLFSGNKKSYFERQRQCNDHKEKVQKRRTKS